MNSLEVPMIAQSCDHEGCCTTTADGVAVCRAPQPNGTWHKIRGAVMLALGCALSPCCTILLVPLGLALLGGTPVALWVSHHLGLVYGGLTLLSIASFIIGFRWLRS